MNTETIEAIHAHAIREFPRECCGLVVVVKGRERYIECSNAAEGAGDHFVLPAEEYADAEELGEIVAVVHSHPNASARASEADMVTCEATGLPWHIVAVHKGVDHDVPEVVQIATHEPRGYVAPLVGRTFSHGVLDCWAVVRDWHSREVGIELPNPARSDKWWDDGASDLYSEKAMAGAGFERLGGLSDLKRGDVITMQIRNKNDVANHAAVYLGDGVILHHLQNRLSSRDMFGGHYLEMTRAMYRHKEMNHE